MKTTSLPLLLSVVVLSFVVATSTLAEAKDLSDSTDPTEGNSFLASNLLVTWYGNPHTGLMGVLGQYSGDDLARRLQRQADAYVGLTDRKVTGGYELIAVVAQDHAGNDGKWRRREDAEVIDSVLQEARAHGFKLVLDIQPGQSTVQDELDFLRPWIEQPDVFVALDPEFDMWKGQTPGIEIGHMTADEINYAIGFLEEIIARQGLPPKVLIVHQFTLNMVPDKAQVRPGQNVDVVLDMDGFGAQWLKTDTWKMVMDEPLEYSGIKLFYDQDPGMFTPHEAMALEPAPSVVIYQ